jgi:adenosylhomocysteine nucleosidase
VNKNVVSVPVVVLISAGTEWRAVRAACLGATCHEAPLGEWFPWKFDLGANVIQTIFFHGGWAKIAAAASTQYVIDRWQPKMVVNLGTCGGFRGGIERGAIVLAERTVVYDILELMGDPEEAIARYTTELDLSWLGDEPPHPVCRTVLVSGDRDLVAEQVDALRATYGAVAGDWESGAIAYVARRNAVPCLILRGVTDLVDGEGGEAYGNIDFFRRATGPIMNRLLAQLPDWLARLPASFWMDQG